MRISNRLEALTFFVPYNSKVIDVGTDHALLPIYLIENDLVCNPVIASDNKYGPLETAKKNIAMYDLQSKISLCLSDGLKEVESDFDCVIIAGMGGSLISKILNDSKEKLNQVKTLILQPNNSEYAVREFLKNNNFRITNEMIVYEDDHYYTIIVAEHGENDYDDYDLLYGPILRREKSINFLDMLNKKADKLYEIIQKYENKDDAQYKLLCNQLLELEYIIDN